MIKTGWELPSVISSAREKIGLVQTRRKIVPVAHIMSTVNSLYQMILKPRLYTSFVNLAWCRWHISWQLGFYLHNLDYSSLMNISFCHWRKPESLSRTNRQGLWTFIVVSLWRHIAHPRIFPVFISELWLSSRLRPFRICEWTVIHNIYVYFDEGR